MLTVAFLVLAAQGSLLQPGVAAPRGQGWLLAQADLGPPPLPPPGMAPGKTVDQLRSDYEALAQSRPSLGGSIAMLAIGVALGIGGAVVTLYGAVFVFSGLYASSFLGALLIAGIVLVVVGVAALAVGITLAAIGGSKLGRTIRERNAIGEQMNALDAQIRQLEQGQQPEGAPPPPMSVERERGPLPLATVATF